MNCPKISAVHSLKSGPGPQKTLKVHNKQYLAFQDRGRAECTHPQEVLRQDAHHIGSKRAHEVLNLQGVIPERYHVTVPKESTSVQAA